MRFKMHVKKNDVVEVISGKEKGKIGKVIKALPRVQAVLVEKLNLVKKHTKPTQKNPQGGILEKAMPIHVSNVRLLEKKK